MRVVGGKFRGRTLFAPDGMATRPTSDRVRESLFNILEHGPARLAFEGLRVLDLFAGTGALGIEALSRGARFALFVEDDLEARAAIRLNVEALGLMGASKIWRRDATRLGSSDGRTAYDLVFLDPPYGQGLGEQGLVAARDGGWLKPGAVAVLEERAELQVVVPDGFAAIDRRIYGDTQIVLMRLG